MHTGKRGTKKQPDGFFFPSFLALYFSCFVLPGQRAVGSLAPHASCLPFHHGVWDGMFVKLAPVDRRMRVYQVGMYLTYLS